MPLTNDRSILLTSNQYVINYVLLSLAGSMHLAGLCPKQSLCSDILSFQSGSRSQQQQDRETPDPQVVSTSR